MPIRNNVSVDGEDSEFQRIKAEKKENKLRVTWNIKIQKMKAEKTKKKGDVMKLKGKMLLSEFTCRSCFEIGVHCSSP
jgi:hypothetical protein